MVFQNYEIKMLHRKFRIRLIRDNFYYGHGTCYIHVEVISVSGVRQLEFTWFSGFIGFQYC